MRRGLLFLTGLLVGAAVVQWWHRLPDLPAPAPAPTPTWYHMRAFDRQGREVPVDIWRPRTIGGPIPEHRGRA